MGAVLTGGSRHLGKTLDITAGKSFTSGDGRLPRMWHHQDFAPSCSAELALFLTRLLGHSRSCLVRGCVVSGHDGQWIRRSWRADPKDPDVAPHLEDCDDWWMAVDIDAMPMPGWATPHTHPAQVAKHARSQMPYWLASAECVWRASSSYLPAGANVKMHLFFMLDRGVSTLGLRDYFTDRDAQIDTSIYHPAGLLYTAAPRLVGKHPQDPLPQRVGVLDGRIASPPLAVRTCSERAKWLRFVADNRPTPTPVRHGADHERVMRYAVSKICGAGEGGRHDAIRGMIFWLDELNVPRRLFEPHILSAAASVYNNSPRRMRDVQRLLG